MEKIPILLLIFCRKDNALEMFKSVKEYKPSKLYIAADGPRANKKGEDKACAETRKALLDAVDWDCDVKTLFRKENLGCAKAVSSAINWFFEYEEWGVIIEDDIILSLDFYKLCEDLLPRYKNENHIQQISAENHGSLLNHSNTYTFQKKTFIWGWATWRRAWQKHMDMSMQKWPQYRMWKLVKYYGLLQTMYYYCYWNYLYSHLDNNTSWATLWHFAGVVNDFVSICPQTNLAVNIGCSGVNGTHYLPDETNPYADLKIGNLDFPLQHPDKVELDWKQVRMDNEDFIRLRILGIKKKFKRFIKNTCIGNNSMQDGLKL